MQSNECSIAKTLSAFFGKAGTVAGPKRELGPLGVNMQGFCIDRHNGFINGLFVDFSVRSVGLKELWKLKWHREFDRNAEPPVWPEWMKNFKDYD